MVPLQALQLLQLPVDWQSMDYLTSFLLYLIDQFDFNCQKDARGEKIYGTRMIVALF